jgi:multimeric flavodoxin WrbA
MKVVAFNGSPNKEGNTFYALQMVGNELEKEGIEFEIVHMGNKAIRGCVGCYQCTKNKDNKCVLPGDDVNEWIQLMKEADGILLAAPVYYAGIAGSMKSFLDRAFYVSGKDGTIFRHKVGAALVTLRRSGGISSWHELNNYLMACNEMIIPTSKYWNVIHGKSPGEVSQDIEGVQTMEVLGRNMAWLLKLIEYGKESIPAPKQVIKTPMNFIR